MLDKEMYYNILFQKLCDNNLISKNDKQWRKDLQSYVDYAEIDRELCRELKVNYGVGFENVILVNAKKNALICDSFSQKKNILLISSAVYFSLLGCVLDYLLDSGNINFRQIVNEKLNWSYCEQYFLKFNYKTSECAIDRIFEYISVGMKYISENNNNYYKELIKKIKSAVVAEMSVVNHYKDINHNDDKNSNYNNYKNTNHKNIYYHNYKNIINKSAVFVQVASGINLADKSSWTKEEIRTIKYIGYIFAIIDDLCDVYEDIDVGQGNLISKYIFTQEDFFFVDKYMDKLFCYMNYVKMNTSDALYEFLCNEIKEWSMSSEELRTRIWRYYGKYYDNKKM